MKPLDPTRWYVRYWLACRGIVDAFHDQNYESVDRPSNLCAMFHTMAWYAPLIVLAHLALVAGALAIAFVEPLIIMGKTATGNLWIGIVVIAVAVVAFLVLVRYLKARARARAFEEPVRKEKEKTGPSLWDLLWEWVKATKGRYCPTISIDRGI